jgi:hypothetical protein
VQILNKLDAGSNQAKLLAVGFAFGHTRGFHNLCYRAGHLAVLELRRLQGSLQAVAPDGSAYQPGGAVSSCPVKAVARLVPAACGAANFDRPPKSQGSTRGQRSGYIKARVEPILRAGLNPAVALVAHADRVTRRPDMGAR